MLGILAWVLGILGGFCALFGILTAAEVMTEFTESFTAIFWLALSAVFFLACIAVTIARSEYE